MIPIPSTQTIPTEVQLAVDALDDRRAKNIRVLDLTDVSSSLSYFIIATGESSLQLKALEDSVKDKLKTAGIPPKAIEGPSQSWTLVDYGFVIVHIMSDEAREFYDLEGLWADAAELEVVPN